MNFREIADNIDLGMTWCHSSEGHTYWSKVVDRLRNLHNNIDHAKTLSWSAPSPEGRAIISNPARDRRLLQSAAQAVRTEMLRVSPQLHESSSFWDSVADRLELYGSGAITIGVGPVRAMTAKDRLLLVIQHENERRELAVMGQQPDQTKETA